MKHELLSPAGSLDICKAVINAGADAVYLGGDKFGARAFAKNFTQSDIREALDFAHLRGKKIFLTVNTLLKNKEIETELFTYLKPLYEYGLDAVIVQDYGVFQFIYRNFPVGITCKYPDVCGKCSRSEILDGSWRRADRYSQRTFRCRNPAYL